MSGEQGAAGVEEVDTEAALPRLRTWVIKADGIVQETNALQDVEDEKVLSFDGTETIPYHYDPRLLNKLFEHSNSLRQNVDAYSTNIDGFGHVYTPVIDLEADDTDDRVRAVMQLERQKALDVIDVADPTTAEVDARKKKLADEQRIETLKLESFFDYCTDTSFPELRQITRQDIETTGNGYWEVIRTLKGEPSKFVYLESHTMMLTKVDTVLTEYEVKRRLPTQDFQKVKERRRFRRFVQRVGLTRVFFKEFGDPRVMSAKTGVFFKDRAAFLLAKNEKDGPEAGAYEATEVIHWKVHSSTGPYGVPRWIGNILSVMGSRSCEEVNYMYFENKSVPPLAVIVSGGRLGAESVERLKHYFRDHIRGKENYHKILVIEADGESASGFENSGRMKVELKPLTEAQTQDGQFQNYDERNIDKVGMSFRLPRMLRGDTRDFNRSTAQAALDFAERQVFEPLRTAFDNFVNRHILPALNIRHYRIKSNGPTQRDPESLAKMIHDLQDVFPPNTLMELAQGVFHRNFSRVDAPWAEQPLKLTIAERATKNNVAGTPAAQDANPDNNAPNNEPLPPGSKSSANQDPANQDPANNGKKGQPRDGSGRFGNKGKAKPATTKKSVEDVVSGLLLLRGYLQDEAQGEARARIAESR